MNSGLEIRVELALASRRINRDLFFAFCTYGELMNIKSTILDKIFGTK